MCLCCMTDRQHGLLELTNMVMRVLVSDQHIWQWPRSPVIIIDVMSEWLMWEWLRLMCPQ
jgi:hypothetical protein